MANYVASLTPERFATNVALAGSSFFFFGNLSHVLFGQVPMLQSGHIDLDNQTKAKIWRYMFDGAKAKFSAASMISTAAFSITGYYARERYPSFYFAIAGAVSSLFIGPWTLIQMMPVNNALISISESKDDPKASYSDKLISKWAQLHNVRMAASSVSLICAYALVNDLTH